MNSNIPISKKQLEKFCQAHGIWRLSVFGSALREDFGPGSDIDFLVEFEPGGVPGLFSLAGMELELSQLLGGRKVDLRTPEDLSQDFRQKVMDAAEPQYVRK